MANTFTDYFENVKNIVKEKGAWYRIFTMLIIGIIYNIGASFLSPVESNGKPVLPVEINVPLLILVILCAILLSGYALQVYSNRMNNQDNLIPKVDFLKMFVCGIKAIPFYAVWTLYFILIFVVLGILCGILGSAVSVLRPLLMFVGVLAFLVIIPAWYSVIALFAKDFSYKGHLNPLLLCDMISKTLLKIYAASFAAFLSTLGIFGVICLFIFPFTKNYMSMQPEMLFVLGAIGLILFMYIIQVLGYALSCSIADITSDEVDLQSANADKSNDVVSSEYVVPEDQKDNNDERLDI